MSTDENPPTHDDQSADGNNRDAADLRALLESARSSAVTGATPGPNTARSQDDLNGDDGLPR